jgi:hypothetical protein
MTVSGAVCGLAHIAASLLIRFSDFRTVSLIPSAKELPQGACPHAIEIERKTAEEAIDEQ